MTGSPVPRSAAVPAIVFVLLIASLVFPPLAGGASASPVISSTGQPIASVFEGLKPSWFAHPSVLKRWQPAGRSSRVWKGQLSYRLPLSPLNAQGARYVEAQ